MKSAYIILRHRRHWFGIETIAVETYGDLETAALRRDYLAMSSKKPRNRFSICITPYK